MTDVQASGVTQEPPPFRASDAPDRPRPAAWLVASIITFTQAGLTLLGGLASALTATLMLREDDTDFPWVDADGVRYESESAALDDDGDAVGVSYDPGGDFPWDFLAVTLSITVAISVVLLVLGVFVLRNRRWAAFALIAVQSLAVVALACAVITIATDDYDSSGAFVTPVVMTALPVAVVVSLVVGFVRRRRTA